MPPPTSVLCRFRFDTNSLRDMMSALPHCIHIRQAEGAGWLDGIVRFLLLEANDAQPGAALMVSRLIDFGCDPYLAELDTPRSGSGWFGGLTDPRIANVLKAIHERPMQRWSVETLASICRNVPVELLRTLHGSGWPPPFTLPQRGTG